MSDFVHLTAPREDPTDRRTSAQRHNDDELERREQHAARALDHEHPAQGAYYGFGNAHPPMDDFVVTFGAADQLWVVDGETGLLKHRVVKGTARD